MGERTEVRAGWLSLAMNRTELVIGEVKEPLDVTDTQKILDYLSLQSNASRSFRADLDVTSRVALCTQQIHARSAYQVWADASSGSAESCLDLGLRSVLFFDFSPPLKVI